LLNDQDLSTYGIVQNLAWGGAVPVLADRLGWDAQAVVSRVREGETPKAPTRGYRLSGDLRQEGVLEFDEGIREALGEEGLEEVAKATLNMLAEVLRAQVEVRLAPAPEGDQVAGEWVETSVRVVVADSTLEVAQYVRPTDVGQVVAAFSRSDAEPAPEVAAAFEASAEELLAPDTLPSQAPDATPAGAPAQPAAPPEPSVEYVPQAWPDLPPAQPTPAQPATLGLLYDVPLTLRAELGRTVRRVEEIIALGPGSVIDLDRMVGDMVDLYANGQWVARGEVVVVEENFGVRITEIGTASERVSRLRLREGS